MQPKIIKIILFIFFMFLYNFLFTYSPLASIFNSRCKGTGYFKILQYLIIGIFISSK